MARKVKELMLAELEKKFRNVNETGCVLITYSAIKATVAATLREGVRQKGAEVFVVKNNLFALAMEHLGATGLDTLLKGPTAVVHGQDPISAARTARDLAKAYATIQIRGAYVDGNVINAAGVERLADTPPREVLLSMVAGALLAPLRRLAGGLTARQRELLSCLNQLKDRQNFEALN